MKKYILLTVLFIFIVLTNCSKSNVSVELPEDLLTISIDPDEASEESVSGLIKDKSYLKLSTPDSLYFAGITKILFSNNEIVVLDKSQDLDRVFCFSRDGNFKYLINRPGRGPGEFEHIYDIALFEAELIINSPEGVKLFDLSTGKYLRELPRPKDMFLQMFKMLDDNVVITSGGTTRNNTSRNLIKIYDLDKEKMIYESVPFEEYALKGGHTQRYLFEYQDTMTVIPMYSPVVYRVFPDSSFYVTKPAYQFDFGDYWVPSKILENSYDKRQEFFDAMSRSVHTLDIYETEPVIYTHFRYMQEDYTAVYYKSIGETHLISGFKDNGTGWIRVPVGVDDNAIVNVVSPADVAEYGLEPTGELDALLRSLNDESHPVLIFSEF